MPNEKIVRLLQVKILPEYRKEILQAVQANKLPTRADKGVEVYYQTARKDNPQYTDILCGFRVARRVRFPS